MEGLRSIFAENAVWHAASRNRFAGEKRTGCGVRPLRPDRRGHERDVPHGIVASGEHVEDRQTWDEFLT
jgi:hypothetical protein